MGAAWRELGNKKGAFRSILESIRAVDSLGLEVCCTLGMVNPEQARQLKEAGLSAYNHNLDTSREHYPKVITTRTYEDRLQTIANVRDAGISVCCGGILGLGEKDADRVSLLHTLATLPEHPESVPINALVAIDGTPLGGVEAPTALEMGRMIATARIVLPRTMVRLSAGRLSFSESEQAMMFMAGANSIFNGDKLLTTANPEFSADQMLFEKLGLRKPAHQPPSPPPSRVLVVAADDGARGTRAGRALGPPWVPTVPRGVSRGVRGRGRGAREGHARARTRARARGALATRTRRARGRRRLTGCPREFGRAQRRSCRSSPP